MNIELQGELAKVQARVESVSEIVTTVKSDMSKYEERWEATCKQINDRLDKLEKKSTSYDNKMTLIRSDVARDLKVVQSSLDSNSKQILEMEAFVKQSKDKWVSLHTLEGQIKHAADQKFRAIQTALKDELKTDIHQVFISDLKEELIKDIGGANYQHVTPADLDKAKKEVLEEVQAQSVNYQLVTPADLDKAKKRSFRGSPGSKRESFIRSQI